MKINKARRLVLTAIDEWEQLKYLHQLVQHTAEEQDAGILILYSDCYDKLSAIHRQKLDDTLYALSDCLNKLP